jgi:spoIIIJ-associated protein
MDSDPSSAERSFAATPKPGATDPEKYLSALESLLRSLIAHSPFELTFSIRKVAVRADDPKAPEYVVDFSGADADLLLEKNAALLDALEHVALKATRWDEDHFWKISFDCQDWRQMRVEELRLMAQVAAERVIETGDPFALSPMNPRERRVIHLALRDQPKVRTQSEGAGPERKVVILPADLPFDGTRR